MRLFRLLVVLRQASVPQGTLRIDYDPTAEFADIAKLAANPVVDFRNGQRDVIRSDAAVKEKNIIDLDDGIVVANPAAVLPVGSELEAVLEEAKRTITEPLLLVGKVEIWQTFRRRVSLEILDVILVVRIRSLLEFMFRNASYSPG